MYPQHNAAAFAGVMFLVSSFAILAFRAFLTAPAFLVLAHFRRVDGVLDSGLGTVLILLFVD